MSDSPDERTAPLPDSDTHRPLHYIRTWKEVITCCSGYCF